MGVMWYLVSFDVFLWALVHLHAVVPQRKEATASVVTCIHVIVGSSHHHSSCLNWPIWP